MATIHDIARELNITASTVSRALQDNPRISESTKKAVLKVAKKLNYQPNLIAAALRNGKTKIIGIIVPTADRSFFSAAIGGIEKIANLGQYNVMICQTHDDYNKEVSAVEALLNARVAGIIASFAKETENFDHFLKAKKKGVPVILFDRSNQSLDVSHVVIDDYLGAYQAVEHLIQQGYKRIGHFSSIKKLTIYKERLRGYKEALENHGIPFDKELVIEGYMQIEDGKKGMKQLLELPHPPDAVFSSSDFSAMGAMQILKERGIKIGKEFGLIGFSNEAFTNFCEPPLTTVDQQSSQIGQAATEIFLDQINSPEGQFVPKRIVLTPELLIRKSSLKTT